MIVYDFSGIYHRIWKASSFSNNMYIVGKTMEKEVFNKKLSLGIICNNYCNWLCNNYVE